MNLRMNSSSGGMFTLLANEIINRGGAVCGAAFINGKVCHIVIDDIKDLSKLRKSKYVQSDISNVFEPILKLLKVERHVNVKLLKTTVKIMIMDYIR